MSGGSYTLTIVIVNSYVNLSDVQSGFDTDTICRSSGCGDCGGGGGGGVCEGGEGGERGYKKVHLGKEKLLYVIIT